VRGSQALLQPVPIIEGDNKEVGPRRIRDTGCKRVVDYRDDRPIDANGREVKSISVAIRFRESEGAKRSGDELITVMLTATQLAQRTKALPVSFVQPFCDPSRRSVLVIASRGVWVSRLDLEDRSPSTDDEEPVASSFALRVALTQDRQGAYEIGYPHLSSDVTHPELPR
jgi:hypothetical protein